MAFGYLKIKKLNEMGDEALSFSFWLGSTLL